MPKKNAGMVSNHTERKNYSYTKGVCNLSFQLRSDIKTEMKDFLECLKLAIKEVEEDLSKKQ